MLNYIKYYTRALVKGGSREVVIEQFKLDGGLSKEQIKKLHEKALYLVENVGINIPHDGILKRLADYKGVTIKNNNVKFKSDLVEKALREAKYILPDYAKNEWLIDAVALQTKTYDLDSVKLRGTTLNDLINLIKLGVAYGGTGSVPVVPLDQPTYLQEILMHKIAYEYSNRRCNDIFEHMDKQTTLAAKYILEMAKTANKWFTFGIWMISPRSFDKNNLEVAYNLLDKGIPMWVATMPIAGVSAPITMLSTILQSMFENFAGLTMLNLINTKSFNYIAPNDAFEADAFDFKYSVFVYGSAEYSRAQTFKGQLCKFYNIPYIAKTMNPAGKEADEQCAFEVGANTLIAALMGARAFRTGGCVSACEIYSAEQLVIDYEIVEYIKKILEIEEFNESRLLTDEIASSVPHQSFLDKDSTVKNFRKEYYLPELFTHSNLGQWIKSGSKSISKYANELAKKKISEYHYQLDKNVKKELDKIYECAVNDQKLKELYPKN